MTTWDSTLGASVQQSTIGFGGSGDSIVIVGIPGLQTKVLQFFLVISAATTLTYKSGVTALSGPLVFPAAATQVQDFIQLPLTCNVGDNFIINTTISVTVGGTVWFIQQ